MGCSRCFDGNRRLPNCRHLRGVANICRCQYRFEMNEPFPSDTEKGNLLYLFTILLKYSWNNGDIPLHFVALLQMLPPIQ